MDASLPHDNSVTVRSPMARDAVAVVGIGCRLPGAQTPDAFWRSLTAGVNQISAFPADRARRMPLEWGTADAPELDDCRGGFVADVERFDAAFFGLSPREAELMDPQQRLLLEVIWHALEDARMPPSQLAGTKTGVFVGVCNTDYGEFLDANAAADDLYVTTGTFASMLANRTSFLFDLRGPSVSVDTSCSSSLVAVHMALRALHAGECDTALVAGANLCLTPKRFRSFGSGGMLSADAQCKVFDAGANGYVRGEGIAAIVLQRADAARAAGRRVHGLLRGSATNHGGRTKGLTVTNPAQQSRLILDAAADAGVPLDTLGYVEAHGTGTALGDPIEFLGLKLAFEQAIAEGAAPIKGRCALGSVKTNIGHLEAAAGIAGLIKALLAVRHGVIPASLNIKTLNPLIKLGGTPFRIAERTQRWEPPREPGATMPRRAGVSSFGFGGAYAHVIVEEHPEDPAPHPVPAETPAVMMVTSSDEAGLRRQATALAGFLRTDAAAAVPLQAIARTLQEGREPLEWRLAFPAATHQGAAALLSAFASGDAGSAPLHLGRATKRVAGTFAFRRDPALCAAVASWLRAAGCDADADSWDMIEEPPWDRLYDTGGPAMVDLPLYAFAPDAFWAPVHAEPAEALAVQPETDPEPIVLALRWEAADRDSGGDRPAPTDRFLVVGNDDDTRDTAAAFFGDNYLLTSAQASAEARAGRLGATAAVAGLVWLAPSARSRGVGDDGADPDAECEALRTVLGALRRRPSDGRFDVLIVGDAGTPGDVPPEAAGPPAWIGIDADWPSDWRLGRIGTAGDPFPWPEAMERHAAADGGWHLWRDGRWFDPRSVPVRFAADPVPRFRQGGTYLLLGSGSLADDLSRSLIASFGATVIRVEADGEKDDYSGPRRLKSVAGTPVVLRVGRLDDAAMASVRTTVAADFGSLHGVLYVADAQADGHRPDAWPTPPVDVQPWRDPAGGGALDFVLVVACCTDTALARGDIIARHAAMAAIGRDGLCPVKVVTLAASTRGDPPGTEEQRWRLLGHLLDGPLHHLSMSGVGRPGANSGAAVLVLPELIPPAIVQAVHRSCGVAGPVGPAGAEAAADKALLDRRIASLLFWQLDRLGLAGTSSAGERVGRLGLPPTNARWLARTAQVVGDGPADGSTGPDDAWDGWRADRERWLAHGVLLPQIAILDAVLGDLPGLIAGTTPLTEVLFPGSSMRLMEGYYKNNPVADFFNDALGDSLARYLDQRLDRDPTARFRVLEIGAGTGGATERVLRKLRAHHPHLAEYRYTDLSPSFLEHGRQAYGATAPFLTFALHDVEQPVEDQGIAPGTYDAVVANNVLHATRDMRATIRNAKAALKRNGLLLLNEINRFDLFLHAAFGLFDGWWLFEDSALRIPGTPALGTETWKRLLATEGFHAIGVPTRVASALGQDVIVAASDGVVATRRVSSDEQQAHQERTAAAAPHPIPDTLPRPGDTSPETATEGVLAVILDAVGGQLRMDASQIDLDKAFSDYGMDSIVGVRTVKDINARLGTGLSTIALFDFSTPRKLVEHIVTTHGDKHAGLFSTPPTPRAPPPSPTPAFAAAGTVVSRAKTCDLRPGVPIAVIGMSGRYPGSATLAALWDHLAAGDVLVAEPTRWDLDERFARELPPGGRYCRKGGFLDDVAGFDPTFFNISGAEALCMDPQQRIFLEEAWNALEDAGYAGEATEGTRCGVYAGYIGGDYEQLFPSLAPPQTMWGNAGSMLAARIAYVLNLRGPAITVDTACSSSLVALHVACQGLWSGETDLALAGGVFVQSTPAFFVSANRAAMLSPDGHCYPFDDRAGGFVPGEGAGVVALKRLDDATRDGDTIHGVIRASGINQDGASNGITAPSALAQEELQRRIYDNFGIDPGEISLVEAHGTGTKLGDPIELRGLTNAFRASTARQGFCAIGSVKANIGHTAAAAGITGVLKILLALRHRQIPPQANYRAENPEIGFDGGPFTIHTRLTDWTPAPGGRRLAAVSSFGLSGTNAHAVIEEAPRRAAIRHHRPAYLLVLSGRSPAERRCQAERLLAHCRADPTLNCGDVCHTLLAGRRHFAHRFAGVIRDRDALLATLAGWAAYDGSDHPDAGTVASGLGEEQSVDREAGKAALERCAREPCRDQAPTDLVLVAKSFMLGHRLAYADLFAGGGFYRVPLPTYPFQRDRYWMGDGLAAAPPRRPDAPSAGSREVEFQFSGDEAFLADHRIDGRQVLPGTCHLAMIHQSMRRDAPGAAVAIHGIGWSRSVAIKAARTLRVEWSRSASGDRTFRIVDATEDDAATVPLASGRVGEATPVTPTRLDLPNLRRLTAVEFDRSALYSFFAARAVAYGSTFRVIKRIWTGRAETGEDLVLAELSSASAEGGSASFELSPGLLDGALQASFASAARDAGPAGRARLLFSIDTVQIASGSPPADPVVVARRLDPAGGATERWDIDVCEADGSVWVAMRNVVFREARPQPEAAQSCTLVRRRWTSASAPAIAPPEAGRPIVVLDPGFAALEEELRQRLTVAATHQLPAHRDVALPGRVEAIGAALLAILQRELRDRTPGATALQIVLPDLWPGDPDFPLTRAVAGLVRTARLEEPDLRVQLVTVPAASTAAQLAAVLSDAAARPGEAELAVRDSALRMVRLEPVDPPPVRSPSWKNGGVYLITGGAGGVGRLLAREIRATAPGAIVVLAGRRDADAIGWIEPNDGLTRYVAADLTAEAAVRACVDAIVATHGRLDGVLHAAGILGDELMFRKSAASLAAVLAPKTLGAHHLDLATRHLPLDVFVLFSSIASVVGNVGQLDYAAANAFLDGFAEHRQVLVERGERSGRTCSIGWPWWQDGGMQVDPRLHESMTRRGLFQLSTRAALDALQDALAIGGQVVVVAGDRSAAATILAEANGAASAPSAVAAATPAAGDMLEQVRSILVETLKVPAERVAPDTPFDEFGVDSILALQVVTELEKRAGTLPKTLLFEHRSLRALSAYLEGRLPARSAVQTSITAAPPEPPNPAPAAAVAAPRRHRSETQDVAIVGLAGRYPQAATLEQFWANLVAGRDCITEVPADRWDHDALFAPGKRLPGKAYTRWGGFLDDIAQFDAAFFNISPREARIMDPQERIFLQCAYHALEDAGYGRARLGRDTGVFVGAMYNDYPLLAAHAQAGGEALSFLNHPSAIANRVSYAFDLDGPSLAVDTMCSSSLTAIHLACQSILTGECGAAIAGGVNLTIHPNKYLGLSQGLFASSTGRCQAFGQGGDGYVPSEGVGAVLLKPLAAAERDGDRIYGVIKGSAINHGGRTNGFSVPNPAAQRRVVERALDAAEVPAGRLSYVEAHGTGTALGDPIEIAGLADAFARQAAGRQVCAIGSVKSNIGHCEGAAGIAGLTKVLLQMKHGMLVPSIHSTPENPDIAFADTPFRVQRAPAEWPRLDWGDDGPDATARVAGLSSFGAGGSNAHLIIQEHVAPPSPVTGPGPEGAFAVLLSARSRNALTNLARSFADRIEDGSLGDAELPGLAYTLQVGRDAHEHRLAVRVSSARALSAGLQGWLQGNPDCPHLHQAEVRKPGDPMIRLQDDEDIAAAIGDWLRKGKLPELCGLWVQGWVVDWAAMYRGRVRPAILSLPSYPFAADRHWVPVDLTQGTRSPPVAPGGEPVAAPTDVHLFEHSWAPKPAASGILPDPADRLVLAADRFARQAALLGDRCPALRCRLFPSAGAADPAGFRAAAVAVLTLLQERLARGPTRPLLVQLVVPAGADAEGWDALAALLRSTEREDPLVRGQWIALEAAIAAPQFVDRLSENAAQWDDREVRYGNGGREVRGLRTLADGGVAAMPWRRDGVYLLVGGAGALGRLFAAEIGRQAPGATLVLTGRRVAEPGIQAELRALHGPAGTIDYWPLDLRDAAAVRTAVDEVVSRHGALHGVLHLAGELSDGWLAGKSAETFDRVLVPKVDGLVALDRATAHLPLDLFVGFSSVAGVIGNPGQADYATANAFMDAVLAHRAGLVDEGRRHGRTLSLAWPLWRDGGMRVDDAVIGRTREATGMVPIDAAEGIAAFYRGLASGRPAVAVMKGEHARLLAAAQPTRGEPTAADRAPPAEAPAIDKATARVAVADRLRSLLAATLRLSPDSVATDAPLERFGIDSVMALEMIDALEQDLGKLPKTLFFQHSTLDALSAYLVELRPDACRTLAAPPTPTPTPPATLGLAENGAARAPASIAPRDTGEVAIIGLSGRYPGARDLDQFWQNLVEGRDSVVEVPAERWDMATLYDTEKGKPGTLYCRWGGFIDGVDEFDALFFNVSPHEAQSMGPQERLFLQCCYHAIEDAGYTRANLCRSAAKGRDRAVGVFAGVMYDEYQLLNMLPLEEGSAGPSSSPASVANRVSYFCDFRGPSLAVNTMCSSSLSAIHLACESLRTGACEVAIAGGVNVSIHPSKYVTLSQGQFVSEAGRCASFGRGGDGYVPGEGVGAVVLKPLARAIADGDHVHGVIRGSGISHGGKGNGYTVPLARAQAELVRGVLDEAGVAPSALGYVEAHGTGTALGDPIEIEGLAEAFGPTAPNHQCALGSVKSNIGHCESAAGIAGLTKVLLQMKHSTIAPSLHSGVPNPHIDFAGTPFFVPQRAQPWPAKMATGDRRLPRLAAVSSFGAGGANAHLVVSEAARPGWNVPAETAGDESDGPVLIVLSARSKARLLLVAQRLRDAAEGWRDGDLASVGFTLQTGREAMEHRLALVADSAAAARVALDGFLDGRGPGGVMVGQASGSGVEPDADADAGGALAARLAALGRVWVRGAAVDWHALHPRPPRRVPLPTYPFEPRRHWVSLASAPGAVPVREPAHSLITRIEEATVAGARATSAFTGTEPAFSDHRVDGRPTMPGTGSLEMALAVAARWPDGPHPAGSAITVRNVRWLRAMTVETPLTVRTELNRLPDGTVAFRIVGADAGSEDAVPVYATGQVVAGSAPAPIPGAVAATVTRTLSGAECYAIFARSGIDYGAAFRCLTELELGSSADGSDIAIASFALPATAGAAGPEPRPVILDAALQSCLGLAMRRHGADTSERLPVLEVPVALHALELARSLPRKGRMVATARADGRMDVTIYDGEGTAAARLVGIDVRRAAATPAPALRPTEERTSLLEPRWLPEAIAAGAECWPAVDARLLVVGGRASAVEPIRRRYPGLLHAPDLARASELATGTSFDHVLMMPGPALDAGPFDALMAEEQVVDAFRLVRALLSQGEGARPIGWTVLTAGAQAVTESEAVDPSGAGLHGFWGSVAKEVEAWQVRLVDLAAGEATPPAAMWSLPASASGETVAMREGTALRQRLVPAAASAPRPDPFRTGGCYLIIGGAGGIGEAISEHLVQTYAAQLIWIGRRPLDAAIRAKIDRLAALGPRPDYLSADAADPAALDRAMAAVRALHPRLNGAIHSALDLSDGAIALMDETDFRRALRAKIGATVGFAQQLAGETLDFLAMFSSMQSFARPAGQSNYAAGSTFLDSFAAHLARTAGYPVRTINWGYWATVGAVADSATRARMRNDGFGSIEPAAGVAALGRLLSGDAHQLALVVTLTADALASVRTAATVATMPPPKPVAAAPSLLRRLRERRIQAEAR